mgnify:CR=1 FL=1
MAFQGAENEDFVENLIVKPAAVPEHDQSENRPLTTNILKSSYKILATSLTVGLAHERAY